MTGLGGQRGPGAGDRGRDAASPTSAAEHAAESAGVAHRVTLAVIVEVGVDRVARSLPFPDARSAVRVGDRGALYPTEIPRKALKTRARAKINPTDFQRPYTGAHEFHPTSNQQALQSQAHRLDSVDAALDVSGALRRDVQPAS